MITINTVVAKRLDLRGRKWVIYTDLNCHRVAGFEVIRRCRTRKEAESFRSFFTRMAECTAEWWELDNYPCAQSP